MYNSYDVRVLFETIENTVIFQGIQFYQYDNITRENKLIITKCSHNFCKDWFDGHVLFLNERRDDNTWTLSSSHEEKYSIFKFGKEGGLINLDKYMLCIPSIKSEWILTKCYQNNIPLLDKDIIDQYEESSISEFYMPTSDKIYTFEQMKDYFENIK